MNRLRLLPVLFSLAIGCGTPGYEKSDAATGSAADAAAGDAGDTRDGETDDAGRDVAPPPPVTELWVTDFSSDCEYDTDCTVVAQGEVCACAPCDNAAIAASQAQAWSAAFAALMCPVPDSQIKCETECEVLLPVCAAGACAVRPPAYYTTEGYDLTCEVDEDCVLAPAGEVCAPCSCGATAVRVEDEEAYLGQRSAVECTPDPRGDCNCMPANVARCRGGQCAAVVE